MASNSNELLSKTIYNYRVNQLLIICIQVKFIHLFIYGNTDEYCHSDLVSHQANIGNSFRRKDNFK